jgi:hypothetical protein
MSPTTLIPDLLTALAMAQISWTGAAAGRFGFRECPVPAAAARARRAGPDPFPLRRRP